MLTKWKRAFWFIFSRQDLQYLPSKAPWQIFLCEIFTWRSQWSCRNPPSPKHLTLLLLSCASVPVALRVPKAGEGGGHADRHIWTLPCCRGPHAFGNAARNCERIHAPPRALEITPCGGARTSLVEGQVTSFGQENAEDVCCSSNNCTLISAQWPSNPSSGPCTGSFASN